MTTPFIIRGFARGISEDDTIGGSQSVVDCKDIDIYSHANKVKLVRDTVISCNTAELPIQDITVTDGVSNSTSKYFFCNGGYIYRDGSDTAVYSGVITANLDKHLFQLGEYVYFTNSAGSYNPMEMNRILKNDTTGTWGSDVDVDIFSAATIKMPNTLFAEGYPVIVSNGVAYMGVGQYITKMSYDIAGIEQLETFFVGNDVIGLSTNGGNIYIYYQDGKIDIWNGIDLVGLYPGSDLGYRVARVKQIGNIVYGISGFLGQDQELFYMNGLQAEVLYTKRYSNLASRNKFDFDYDSNLSSLAYGKGIMYGLDGNKLFGYGKSIKGQPSGYSIVHTLNEDATVNAKMVAYDRGDTFVGYGDGTFTGIKKISLANDYVTSGEVATLLENFDNDLYDKIINGLYFRVEDITATEYIEIEASIDGGTYVALQTVNTQPRENLVEVPIKKLITDRIERISIKFKLFGDGTNTPTLFTELLFKIDNDKIK